MPERWIGQPCLSPKVSTFKLYSLYRHFRGLQFLNQLKSWGGFFNKVEYESKICNTRTVEFNHKGSVNIWECVSTVTRAGLNGLFPISQRLHSPQQTEKKTSCHDIILLYAYHYVNFITDLMLGWRRKEWDDVLHKSSLSFLSLWNLLWQVVHHGPIHEFTIAELLKICF
jgi:hypothetical protein